MKRKRRKRRRKMSYSNSNSQIDDIFSGLDASEEDESEITTQDLKRWGQNGPNAWTGIGVTKRRLESGFYEASIDGAGNPVLIRKPLKTDELIRPKNPILSQVLEEIEAFWKKEDLFKEHGFLHRRGYLFHGPPGSGKTALVQLIMADLIKRGGLIINGARPAFLEMVLPVIRQIEPERQIICLFEDIDAIIKHQGDENLLATLDGESQVDKVLNLATTNYPEQLDKRIKNRPRRFDRVLRVGMPEREIREQYFSIKLGIADDELQDWVNESEGFSFAAMSDLVISVKCFDLTLKEAADKVKDLLFKETNSEGYEKDFRQEKNVGFTA
jgi:hypothetical protein